ncbi:STAG domain-containing protein [Ditylenchus destructor]|uniref:STAG domain-containing protein n=1 Tax=Ditylenchus destructor TaxID=166010 RepID=A0AAD4N3B2_9BILA|nr:STAG domain-containing protein [Ditylenchus destructor]
MIKGWELSRVGDATGGSCRGWELSREKSHPKRDKTKKRGSPHRSSRNGSDNDLNGTNASAKSRPRSAKKRASINEDPSGLCAIVKAGKGLDEAVEEWINEFQQTRDRAVVRFLQFIVSSCGCEGSINNQMLETKDMKQISAELSEDFDIDTAEYPLIATSAEWRKFRANYNRFFMVFVNKGRSSVIRDEDFMGKVFQLLAELSESKLRAFRHTGTVAAMKLATGLVETMESMTKEFEKNNIQIEKEKSKNADETNEKLRAMVFANEELCRNVEQIGPMMSFLKKEVAAKRYRDIVPEVRSVCIEELCNWMRLYPEAFMNSECLKYIGWSLYDKISEVRLKCVSGLQLIFEHGQNIEELEAFSKGFRDRLVSMVMDNDIDVSIKTCHILCSINRLFPDLLEKTHCAPISELVYSSNRSLAMCAGVFVKSRVLHADKTYDSSIEMHMNAEDSRLFLRELIKFYIDDDISLKNMEFLVDSLLSHTPMLRDWSVMVEMLLDENSENMFTTALAELISCAVKQAATGEVPQGRQQIPKRTTAEAREFANEKMKITQIFVPAIPRLLHKFVANQEILIHLLSVMKHLQLEVYTLIRFNFKPSLDETMQILQAIVEERNASELLLNKIAAVIAYLSTANAEVSKKIKDDREKLLNSLCTKLVSNVNQYCGMKEEDESKQEKEDELLIDYMKMTAFLALLDISNEELWDATLRLVKNFNQIQSATLIGKGIQLLFEYLAWNLRKVIKNDSSEDEISSLRTKRDDFLQCMREIIDNGANGVESAYTFLCDTLIIFNFHLALDSHNYELMKTLPIKLNSAFTEKISGFLRDNVFEEEESFNQMDLDQQTDVLDKRRIYVAYFCKLILHGVMPLVDASLVLRHYNKFSHHFDDLLKLLFQKCREIDRVAAAKTVILTLISLYDEMKDISTQGYVNPASEEFTELRAVAKKFALSFGPDIARNREAIVMIHKDGIGHAFDVEAQRRLKIKNPQPSSVSFLDVLVDFSPKLAGQDKNVILHYLEKHCPVKPEPPSPEDDSFWQPYWNYRNSLTKKKN